MNSFTWTIIEILASLVDMIFVLLIPTFQLGRMQKWVKKWHVVGYIILSTAGLVIYNYLTNNHVSSVGFAFVWILAYVVYFNIGTWVEKIFWSVFLCSTVFFLGSVVIDLIVDFFQITFEEILVSNKYRLLLLVATKLIEIVAILFSYRHRLSLNTSFNKKLIIPISISFIALFLLESLGVRIWYFTVIFLTVNYIYLTLIIRNNRRQEVELKVKEERMKARLQRDFETMILNQYIDQYQGNINEALKIIWEQMKIDNSSNKSIISDKMCQINLNLNPVFNTGNKVLDMMLSLKKNYTREKGIDLRGRIGKLNSTFDYSDIAKILSHLINNSAEAIEKISLAEDIDKSITFTMSEQEHAYYIEVENPTDCNPIPPLKTLLSDQNKGEGLKEVQKIVNQYDGEMSALYADGYFTITIKLPVEHSQQEVKQRA